MAELDARTKADLTEMMVVLANLMGNPDGITELTAGYGTSERWPPMDKYSISFRRNPSVDVRSATSLPTEKRLALAVLLNDLGAANALADYLQDIGVIPKPDAPILSAGRNPIPIGHPPDYGGFTHYVGPHGGRGYRDPETGRIYYNPVVGESSTDNGD